MRRQFNPALLPTKIPEKYTAMRPRIPNNIKCKEVMNLFLALIAECNGHYDEEQFADFIGLAVSTVRHYKYGRPPGRDKHIAISRYFAALTSRKYADILQDLRRVYDIAHRRTK